MKGEREFLLCQEFEVSGEREFLFLGEVLTAQLGCPALSQLVSDSGSFPVFQIQSCQKWF